MIGRGTGTQCRELAASTDYRNDWLGSRCCQSSPYNVVSKPWLTLAIGSVTRSEADHLA
jgi:hypothetical protein